MQRALRTTKQDLPESPNTPHRGDPGMALSAQKEEAW